MKVTQQQENRPQGDARAWPRFSFLGYALALILAGPVLAGDIKTIEVTIKNHQFSPSEIHVPAGQPIMLIVKNEDATAEEFESSALKVEKVIVGGGTAKLRLRPLAPGRYPFMGEYHPESAQGVVISE
ncbi:MAG TPA: cupredoxin domain-containing protein [Burkholderiales bacterium]|nr:cupredoxin domain-containing protein [Burkholderiales bacterium]